MSGGDHQLRIELLGVKPLIWRRLPVPATIELHGLHGVLLRTRGWAGGHLHEFVIGDDHYGEPDPYYDTRFCLPSPGCSYRGET
jgi:hypothetical protein